MTCSTTRRTERTWAGVYKRFHDFAEDFSLLSSCFKCGAAMDRGRGQAAEGGVLDVLAKGNGTRATRTALSFSPLLRTRPRLPYSTCCCRLTHPLSLPGRCQRDKTSRGQENRPAILGSNCIWAWGIRLAAPMTGSTAPLTCETVSPLSLAAVCLSLAIHILWEEVPLRQSCVTV